MPPKRKSNKKKGRKAPTSAKSNTAGQSNDTNAGGRVPFGPPRPPAAAPRRRANSDASTDEVRCLVIILLAVFLATNEHHDFPPPHISASYESNAYAGGRMTALQDWGAIAPAMTIQTTPFRYVSNLFVNSPMERMMTLNFFVPAAGPSR